jgi:hypothetical protein
MALDSIEERQKDVDLPLKGEFLNNGGEFLLLMTNGPADPSSKGIISEGRQIRMQDLICIF